MNTGTQIALRTVASFGEDVALLLTKMQRHLLATNRNEALPEGFLDLQTDLASAKATIERVTDEIEAAVRGREVSPV